MKWLRRFPSPGSSHPMPTIRALVVAKGEGKDAGRVICGLPQGHDLTRKLVAILPTVSHFSRRLDAGFSERRPFAVTTRLGRLLLCEDFRHPIILVLAHPDYASSRLPRSLCSSVKECPKVRAFSAEEPLPEECIDPCPLAGLPVHD
ncbi:MAG: hypothetical protein ACE5JQ_08215 [Candidatus Methylomirabilales bacterium]